MKTLYLIRHGVAQHNVLFTNLGRRVFYDERYYDTHLTGEGHEQSRQLGEELKKNDYHDIDLVLTSSLSRALETTYNIFKDFYKPVIAIDVLKEYPQGLQTVNKRKDRNDLQLLYPMIDFSYLKDNKDLMWNDKREETIDELNQRITDFKKFISERSELKIAIVGHSSFIGQLKDQKIGLLENGDKELLHCHPYEYTFE